MESEAARPRPPAPAAPSASDPSAADMEPLACVVCRTRKLKCDRTKPACTRCRGVGGVCVYPGARKKPTFQRRNVKEIEARLAQVESFLRQANRNVHERRESASQPPEVLPPRRGFGFEGAPPGAPDLSDSSNGPRSAGGSGAGFAPDYVAAFQQDDGSVARDGGGGEYALMGLGYSEAVPPFHAQEELNNIFFVAAHHCIPIVHSGRFYQAFYGGPLRKPPMSLQYAMWAMAAAGHAEYDQYAEVFYKRARHYIEVDEMKDKGEHFITIPHAQALCLCATFEAKLMLFTRAATTCAKAVRLCQMMGLDRLDGDQDERPPCLGPHTSWEELEERRRVFWGVFVTDSHASISTGWPMLINTDDIATRLPVSEEAFASGREEVSPFLEEILGGPSYSTFAGVIILCQFFRVILRHVHHRKPSGCPQDMLNDSFWNRHRELDNKLSSTFMFLPARFRLSDGLRCAGAIHLNLNLHAAVIILHHAALEKVEQHDLPASVAETSLARLRTAAEEIANIVKMTSHSTSNYKSPLCALSLYCSTTVYVYVAKKSPGKGLTAVDMANLEIIIQAMEVIGRKHQITRSFLQQACLDIERNGLASVLRFPTLDKYRRFFDGTVGCSIPLISRSSISRHSKITPVLPGRLPLSNPQGRIVPSRSRLDMDAGEEVHAAAHHGCDVINADCFQTVLGAVTRNVGADLGPADGRGRQENKRRRTSPGPSSTSTTNTTTPSFVLADRTSSSTSSPDDLSGSAQTTPPGPGPHTPEENRIGIGAFQGQGQGRTPQGWPAAPGQTPPVPGSLFGTSVADPLFSLAGYTDGTTAPTLWDQWAETMAWGAD